MIGRAVLLGLLGASCALAQLRLFLIDAPGSEAPVSGSFDVGSVPSGDIHDTKFRIRNMGDVSEPLERLRITGVGFSLRGHPSVPYTVAPGSNVDFRVRFLPPGFGSYSAALQINDTVTVILGSSPPSATVSVEQEGALRILSSGETILFGRVERGASAVLRFQLDNPADVTVTVSSLSVAAGAFRPSGLPPTPLNLGPRQSASFLVSFEPVTAGLHQSTLEMNQRSFLLEGIGLDPPYPEPEILFETETLASGQQGTVSVRLAAPAPASGTGELLMEFHPAIEGAADDPAIQFLESGVRSIVVTVQEGETATLLGGRAVAVFQTGTTAGAITFTVRLGTHQKQASVTTPPALVFVDSSSSKRAAASLELRLAGFDNTLSASEIAFTFFDAGARMLSPWPMRVDVARAFKEYFDSAGLGGLFSLVAVFPVAGDPALIGAVEVEFTNRVGPSQKHRVNFR